MGLGVESVYKDFWTLVMFRCINPYLYSAKSHKVNLARHELLFCASMRASNVVQGIVAVGKGPIQLWDRHLFGDEKYELPAHVSCEYKLHHVRTSDSWPIVNVKGIPSRT